MKPVPLLLAMVAVLVSPVSAGCGGPAPSDAAASVEEHHHHTGDDSGDGTADELTVDLGGPVSLSGESGGTEFEVTYAVTALDTAQADDEGNKPADHEVFVVAEVTVRVYRGSHVPGIDNPAYELCFVAADGTEYHQSARAVGPELAGPVEAEGSVTGNAVFDVESDDVEDGRVRLTATANGGDQTIFWKPED